MQYCAQGQINKTVFHTHNTHPNYQYNINQSQQQLTIEFSPPQLQNKLHLNNYQHNQNSKDKKDNLFFNIQSHNADKQNEQEQPQFINSNSIVKRYQLLLITLLIMSSIASVKLSNEGTFTHIKTIRDRFNMRLLGNTNPSIYQYGDNIDQSSTEITIFEDMNQHFDNLVQVITNFTTNDAFIQFNNDLNENVVIEVYELNGQYVKNQTTIKGLQDFIFSINRRQFLLNLDKMTITLLFGSNQRLSNLNLTIAYDLSSRMMLNVEAFINYQPNIKYQKNYNDKTMRVIQQILAFLLLCSYLHNLYTIKYQNSNLKKLNIYTGEIQTLQKNRAYWCYSLVFCNIITILNQTYAPLASFLQLLPIFERHDSSNVYRYNFNTNLRYALPIVMRILIPVVIMLNGFVFYSMLMYPGQYFENYTLGFFSYIYQNFQVGTYEIFIELQSRGNFAYLLYGILYFYMVLVGSNLLPALFCTMIYIKIYQNDLKDYISKTIKTAICPQCGHQNLQHQKQNKHFQINIHSPKISPYLKKGKLSTVNKNASQFNIVNKVTKMFVEAQKIKYEDQKLQLKSTIQKIKTLSLKLQSVIKKTQNARQSELFNQKIQKLINQIQLSIIVSPIRSPLHRGG